MKTFDLTFVVEDDEISSILIEKTIRRNESFKEIQLFENGKAAYDYLNDAIANDKPLPDLIYLDINMPLMDGWEFLDAVQKLGKPGQIPVIMLTSSISEVDLENSKAYPEVKGYFSKPLNNEKVKIIISIVS
jgi:CheY-like chemotaxis protein